MSKDQSTRREFLHTVTIAGTAIAASGLPIARAAQNDPSTSAHPTPRPAKSSNPLHIGIIGVGGRGTELAGSFAGLAGAVVTYVCDVDTARHKGAIAAVMRHQETEPRAVTDLRRVLDDRTVDAVAVATPDHWHAPAAILACQAGKHVYVEKPCCHNPHEGELLVAVAREHQRVVQQGTQRRSWPKNREAMERVLAGDIGKVYLSRGWYNNNRGATGRRTPASVPAGLDWDLWQGPAPRIEFTENVVPYKWHWYWRWGTGELGNNGIHALDLCRWGLGVDAPRRVTAGGGRYHFHDDQETPDTLSATYDFGDKAIVWEGRSCNTRGFEGQDFGAAFYGDRGTLIVDAGGYRILDPKGKVTEQHTGPAGNDGHIQNFLDCIYTGKRPNADIEVGYKSTLLCHLGNITWRTGGAIHCDPKTGHILENADAQSLWGRTYENGWEPKI